MHFQVVWPRMLSLPLSSTRCKAARSGSACCSTTDLVVMAIGTGGGGNVVVAHDNFGGGAVADRVVHVGGATNGGLAGEADL
jgi:hypothetical protein